ncbi:MAG: NAD-binding protein, partial [Desulfobacterales bacterium]|nr:NAD-binding protein [Desulfobacterales bacterium]
QFVIIEIDHRRFENAKKAGMAVVYGDSSQDIVLEAAEIKKATLLILTLPGLVEVKSTILHSKHLNECLEIVTRVSGPDYFEVLKDLGVSEVVLPEFEASLEITRRSLLCLKVPPTEVQRQTDTVRQELYAVLFNNNDNYRILTQLRGAEQQFDLQWVRLAQESPMAHRSIGESEIRKVTGASVVGVVRDGQLRPNPDADFVLMPDDLVAIIGGEENREKFSILASR